MQCCFPYMYNNNIQTLPKPVFTKTKQTARSERGKQVKFDGGFFFLSAIFFYGACCHTSLSKSTFSSCNATLTIFLLCFFLPVTRRHSIRFGTYLRAHMIDTRCFNMTHN